MAINRDAYLRAKKFLANPFATTNAEQETERLASFFLHVPWFDQLVGDPRFPESLIVFAPRGYGKTSHRLEVARLARDRRVDPALVITFTEFDLLLNRPVSELTEVYLATIRRKTVEALSRDLRADPYRCAALQQNAEMSARFCALQKLYAAPLPIVAPPAATDFWCDYYGQRLGFREWLRELAALVGHVGFASVYLLFDGIDEWTETHNDLDVALDLLRPLLDAPGILQETGFAFKFFLPQSLEAPMIHRRIGRLDRIPVHRLAWSDQQLLDMLAQRLTSYSLVSATSPVGYVNSLNDLCDGTVNADEVLVRAADSSPRRLLSLVRLVIEEHCNRAETVEEPISAATLLAVLSREADSPAAPAVAPALPLPAPPTAGPALLCFDERGDIWLGEQRLAHPLPRLLNRCMRYLWQNRWRTVTYEELQAELYHDDPPDRVRGDPRSSCDKIIRRLREALESGQTGSHTYIDVQPGTGYVLRNFREPAATH